MPRKALGRSVAAARKAAARVPKNRGFLAHLWPVEKFESPSVGLPQQVSALRVTYDKSGPGMASTRQFVYNWIPRIRFQHPAVEVTVNKRLELAPHDPEVEVTLEGGVSTTVHTSGLRDEEILAQVREAAEALINQGGKDKAPPS